MTPITAIPMDEAYAHICDEAIREACENGSRSLSIMAHAGRVRLFEACKLAWAMDLLDLSVPTEKRIEQDLAAMRMHRTLHEPERFLLHLRAFWLA
jgi:hypothetical protein